MDLCDNYASKMFQRKKSVLITQLMKPWTEEAYSSQLSNCWRAIYLSHYQASEYFWYAVMHLFYSMFTHYTCIQNPVSALKQKQCTLLRLELPTKKSHRDSQNLASTCMRSRAMTCTACWRVIAMSDLPCVYICHWLVPSLSNDDTTFGIPLFESTLCTVPSPPSHHFLNTCQQPPVSSPLTPLPTATASNQQQLPRQQQHSIYL